MAAGGELRYGYGLRQVPDEEAHALGGSSSSAKPGAGLEVTNESAESGCVIPSGPEIDMVLPAACGQDARATRLCYDPGGCCKEAGAC